ncbi:hypothetical protein [Neptunomonas antarctica]|uniref:DNA-binding protein H-NS-like N-terminal domain-containing protein n=1 Tax=Neptunomonas antarctica TaxID=619304 RepID=A0A1N7K1V3_9GAMM|nr:hypothetical protein [Neptunomonas antarctica]SIS55414.1 hypothetical protein SAMN05421760_102136 [Neptunomonas antarctica]
MTEDEFFSKLSSYSIEQLNQIQIKLDSIADEKRRKVEKRKAAMKVQPRKSSDVEKMADEMGLDLSSLMREISRR